MKQSVTYEADFDRVVRLLTRNPEASRARLPEWDENTYLIYHLWTGHREGHSEERYIFYKVHIAHDESIYVKYTLDEDTIEDLYRNDWIVYEDRQEMSEATYSFGQVIDILKQSPDKYKFKMLPERDGQELNYYLRCKYIDDIPLYYEEYDDGNETVFFWSEIMSFPEMISNLWVKEKVK